MLTRIIGQAVLQAYRCLDYFNNPLKRPRYILLLVIVSLSNSTFAANLPTINTHSSAGMSLEDEYRFGNVIAGSIRKQLPLWNDLAALEFLNDLTQPLISRSQLKNKNVQIFLINDTNINAFAAPGGIIGINTGLIEQAGSVDELVSVLAHEVAHLSLRHYVQTKEQEKTKAPLYFGALIASMWLAGNVKGDIAQASIHATHSIMRRNQLSYKRSHEREADRVGFDLMYRSSFDVSHMQRLLQRLQPPYINESPQWEWARSHPITNERIADVSQRILITQQHKAHHGFDLGFGLLQIYQAATISNTPSSAIVMQKFDPLSDHHSVLLAFSSALANHSLGKLKLAGQQLEKLALMNPSASLIWYSWMQNLLQQQKTPSVIRQLALRQLYRKDSSLSLWIRAQALQQDSKSRAAINVLLALLKEYPTWIIGWRTLAEWSAKDQRLQLNHMAQSQWHLLRGEAHLALKQAQYASQQQPDRQASSVEAQKLKALSLLADQTEFN